MTCDKCHKDKSIEEHHLWPKYMDNPHGYSFRHYVSRIWLCDEHHTDKASHKAGVHQLVITPILKRYSLKSEYESELYLWKNIPIEKRRDCIKEVVEKTWEWINGVKDDRNS